MTEQRDPESPPKDAERSTIDDADLEPVTRDARFVYRIVAALILGAAGALVIGAWMKGAAASCGAGLIRPGVTVIPSR